MQPWYGRASHAVGRTLTRNLDDRTTLDLDEDLPFQRREWRASRLLFGLLLLLMLATAIGLFGNGPLSHLRVDAADGLTVEYDRFGRFGAATRVTVHTRAGADGTTEVALSRSLVENFLITQIVPTPAETELTADAILHRFNARPESRTPIIFDLQPQRRWVITGEIRSGSDSVPLTYFIYP